jgi:hypothetical protein
MKDVMGEYLRIHRAYKRVDGELGVIEERYESAIEALRLAFLGVARMEPCEPCKAQAGKPCLFGGVPTMERVHGARDTAARERIRGLGVEP